MVSLDNLTRLLLASIDDVARIANLLDTAMHQAPYPVFELSPEGDIRYLNQQACKAIGVEPRQAVGTRLATYTTDALMTQRRLDGLLQRNNPQTWADRWWNEHQRLPCQLFGFALPRALSGDRPRTIIWADPPPETTTTGPTAIFTLGLERPAALQISPDQHVLGRDLEPLREKFGVGVNRMSEILGISPMTWYAWRRNDDELIPSRTAALHLRLLDVMPDLARPGTHPAELQEALRTHRGIQVSLSDLALLLGVEGRAGYAWSHGHSASDQVQALTATLLMLVFEKPREAWEFYRLIVERQANLEQIDLTKTQSWNPAQNIEADAQASDLLEPVLRPERRGRPSRSRIDIASDILSTSNKHGTAEPAKENKPPARAARAGKIKRQTTVEPSIPSDIPNGLQPGAGAPAGIPSPTAISAPQSDEPTRTSRLNPPTPPSTCNTNTFRARKKTDKP